MKTFGRVLTAMITSFNDDGSVNIENTVAIAEHLLNHGSDGLVVCGTTGENPTISRESKTALFKAIAKACGDKGTIIANVAGNIPVPTRPGTLYTMIGKVVASAMDLKCKY